MTHISTVVFLKDPVRAINSMVPVLEDDLIELWRQFVHIYERSASPRLWRGRDTCWGSTDVSNPRTFFVLCSLRPVHLWLPIAAVLTKPAFVAQAKPLNAFSSTTALIETKLFYRKITEGTVYAICRLNTGTRSLWLICITPTIGPK